MWSPLALTLTEGGRERPSRAERRARRPRACHCGPWVLWSGVARVAVQWRGQGESVPCARGTPPHALVCNARGGSDQPCALALALISHASPIACSPTTPWRAVQVRASVNQKLEESGEKEKLKELLRKKLIERGWRDELKEYCKEVIKSKGLEQISVEDLVSEITPRGRATIPDDIKADLLERIRKFLASN